MATFGQFPALDCKNCFRPIPLPPAARPDTLEGQGLWPPQFGRKSEKLARQIEQLELRLEDLQGKPAESLYQGLPDLDYPLHDKTIVVPRCGRICLGAKKINFSQVFAGQAVGIKEVHDDIWLVTFMDYDLGYFDLETRVLEPLENPFGPKVLPM